MDIMQVASQLVGFLGNNPQLIQQFIQHPYSTTAQATGSTEQLSREDMSQVVTAAAALSNNQQLPGSDIANIASALLGQNNNSVHALTSMLFGGGNTAQPTQMAQQQTTSNGTLNLGSLVSMALLANTLMNAAKPQAQQTQQAAQASKPSVNLADGLDIGEIATLAGQFLGGGSTAAAAKPQAVPQTQQQTANSIDFGTIAQLASMFLKK
jgi:hypothetical protein